MTAPVDRQATVPMDAPPPTTRALLARRELGLTLAVRADGGPEAVGAGARDSVGVRDGVDGGNGASEDDPLDRPVRWVHNSDLLDPTPFLSEGLALLTTGTQFAEADDDPEVYVAYVERLRARGVVSLGFGTDVVRGGIPPALVDACRNARLPLFEVPYRTPFIAIARANAEAVAAQSYARRSWSLAAQRALSLAALRPDGLGATLAELARQLGAWVGLFDGAGSLTREHPAGGLDPTVADELRAEVGAVLRRGARAGSSLRIGGVPFTLQTLGRGGHLRGVIAIAAGDLDQEGRGVVTAVVAMAGLALEQQQGFDRARARLRSGILRSLLTGDPTLARRIARDLWGGLPAAPVVVALTDAATARSHAVTEWLELRADEHRGSVFFGRDDDGLVIVVNAKDASAGTSGASAGVLTELARAFDARVGASAPTGYDGFATAVEQARLARDRTAEPGVARIADLAETGILTALDGPHARALAAAQLAPLTRFDTDESTALRPTLRETLRAWLEADCSHERAAKALGVHRHTVRARVGLAQRVLGHDLSSFSARADLWTALRMTEPTA